MAKGQSTLELLLGYGIALVIIAISLDLLFVFYPSLFNPQQPSSYSGFAGFRILGQGYDSSGHFFFIKFQNLLNEDINVTKLLFLTSSVNDSAFTCSNIYVPNLASTECNLTITLPLSFSANINIFYTPSNTSTHPSIIVPGSVVN